MKYNELKSKNLKELVEMEKKLREELFHLKLKSVTGQLEKKSQILQVRRDIARLRTRVTALKIETSRG